MNMSGPGSLKSLFGKNRNIDEDKVEEEIISMVEEGHEQGVILEEEAEMINNIFSFNDMDVKEIMTPRQKVSALDQNTSLRDALEFMLEQGYSRYPVYEDDIDRVLGILHLKDAMKVYLHQEDNKITEIMREGFFVPPTQSISKLLSEMQERKIHMAIVVDEYGQTEGVVSMEDILEVIVGNIFDEYDEEETFIRKAGNDVFLMKGMTKLSEVEEALGIEFPDEDIETLNGFLLLKLGRLPMENEIIEIDYEGFVFRPIDIRGKMIRQVKVTKLADR